MKARRAMALWPAVLVMASCATPKVSDATRYSQPVVNTTIAAVQAAPEAWENKYVRLVGFVNGDGSMFYANECLVKALSTRKDDECLGKQTNFDWGITSFYRDELVDLDGYELIDLDPERHLRPGDDRSHTSISEAVVVGRVDLACWRWHQDVSKWFDDYHAAHPDQVAIVEFNPSGKIAYCASAGGGPHLDKVLISRSDTQ